MRTQSIDTDPDVERIQVEGLRRFTLAQRLALASMLTRSVFTLSWQGFRRRYPDVPEAELRIRWCELLYGPDLAQRVAAYLVNRAS
jgi:hypothetical protein